MLDKAICQFLTKKLSHELVIEWILDRAFKVEKLYWNQPGLKLF